MQNGTITLDDISTVVEERDGHSKAVTITRSAMAIVSIISSSTLIWMILRSHARLTTIHHRILLGMSIADILLSLSLAHFNFTAPSDNDYFVWNARGNQATCSTQGFIAFLGATSGVLYICSLNFYYLVVVKYQKSNSCIRKKIEPFLHGIPVILSFVISITLLVKQNLNDAGGGSCYAPVHDPPHCASYEDGQIPEGFDIPCGRGHDGAILFYYVAMFVTFFVVPIFILVSLGMIYRAVLQQERKISQYGAGAYTASAHLTNINDRDGRTFFSCITRSLCRAAQSPRREHSNSRSVLYRALAYSSAYCLTWSFLFIDMCLDIAGVEWPLSVRYLANIFNPLQGFFNFCIFIYPKVTEVKRKGDEGMTWSQAFVRAFWSNGRHHKTERYREQPNTNQIQPTSPKPIEEKSDTRTSQMIAHSPDSIPTSTHNRSNASHCDLRLDDSPLNSGDETGVDHDGRRRGLQAQAVWESETYFKSTLHMIDANDKISLTI